jgi:hypothetical protein
MPAQYRALWSTPGGGAGFSVMHFTTAGTGAAAQQIAADVRAFFLALNTQIPNDVSINFDSEVLDLNEDGTLAAVHAVVPPAVVLGVNNSEFNRAAGAVINWATGVIVAGRRLSGKTYIVPMALNTFDTVGVLTAVSRALLIQEGEDLIAATAANRPLRIWSRTHATSAPAVSCSVPNAGAILRGRRD